MAYSLKELHSVDLGGASQGASSSSALVDIVAVHDLNQDVQNGWADQQTGILWLRDLLPSSIQMARILSFEYESSASSFFDAGCERAIRTTADNLMTSLQSDRELESCPTRPIIFLCHGLGGILVKQALIHSSSQTSPKVEVYYGIFVSTYAIMFFGTPHVGYDIRNWIEIEKPHQRLRRNKAKSIEISSREHGIIRSVNVRFSSLLKHFHVYFFWAERMTDFGDRLDHMVEDLSAAPTIDDTERAAIYADHYSMVQHSKSGDSSYRTILAALLRYSRAAPSLISRRWEKATIYLRRLRSEKAFEISGFDFDIHVEDEARSMPKAREELRNEYFMLPREASTDFVGRVDVIQDMENNLFFNTLGETRQRVVVIHGMGGCGKTRVCCKFAWNHRQRYWGIFTIDATSVQTAKASFSDLGRLGGLEATESAGRHWLATRRLPWLLIVDNADDPTLDVAALLPEGLAGHILITTRNPDIRRLGTASIELKGMKRKEALQLLLKRAEIQVPWEKVTEELGYSIAEALGYLALALIQAGNCISRKLCELDNYLKFHELYKNRHKAEDSRRKSIQDDEVNVYPTFDFSLSSLENRDTVQARDAIEILNVIAFYHFENIRVDIFVRALSNMSKVAQDVNPLSTKDWVLSRVGDVLQPPPVLPRFLKDDRTHFDGKFRILRALYELYKLSLITYTTKGDSFSLHPLIHSWAKDRLNPGERMLWAQLALNTLLSSFDLPPQDIDDKEGSFKRDMLPHLDVCLRNCPLKIGYGSTPPTSFQLTYYKLFGWSLFFILRTQIMAAAKCGYVYASRGRFADAANHLTMAKDALLHILGDQNEKTMMAMLGLANVFWGLGRLEEAISLQSRVVQARTKVYGRHHAETLRALDMLGKSHWLHGQYHEALSIQQVTTKYMPIVLGTEHDDTLATMDNYGVTLGSWQRYEESRDVHAQVLAIRKRRQAAQHLDILTTMNNLAMAFLDLKALDQARALMSEVYDERRKQLGKEHPWTLWALCNFAKVKIELGELGEAEEILIEGIAAGKRSLGDDHLGVLMGCGALALTYARQGRHEESEDLTLKTLRIIERTRGLAHPDSIFAHWKLAQLYEKDGKISEAIERCQIALDRIRMRLGISHPLFDQVNLKMSTLLGETQAEQESEDDRLSTEDNYRLGPSAHRRQNTKTW